MTNAVSIKVPRGCQCCEWAKNEATMFLKRPNQWFLTFFYLGSP